MKKIFLSLAATSLLLTGQAMATNGDQMLGVSAQQWARGGAIVASPVDAPSVLYNPAAAGMLGVETIAFDLGAGLLHAERSITNPMISTDSDSENYFALGAGMVTKISDKAFFSVAAGGVSGLGTDFSQSLIANPATAVVTTKGLLKFQPTFTYKPMENLSLGASVQIGYQTLCMSAAKFSLPQTGEFGFGGSIGAIYEISPMWQLGASFVSKMDVSEYDFHGTHDKDGFMPNYPSVPGTYSLDMDAPATGAFGVAFTPMPKLLIEADVKWIGFSDVMDSIDLTDSSGRVLERLAFGWEDQWVYSIGADFAVTEAITLRAGYNYGATGIDPEDVQHNLGSLAVVEHHLSLGLSRKWSSIPGMTSSLSYTRGFENSVTGNVPTPGGMVPHTLEASQDIAYFQLSYMF